MSFSAPASSIGTVFQGISGILTGVGHLFGAKEETQASEYNAQVFEQQAQAERESQRLLEYQKRKSIKAQIGSQVAAAGASGFRFSGDPITIMQSSLANAELDIAIDKYNSEIRARGAQSSAERERIEGRQAASRQYASAGSSFLGTASNMFLSQIGSSGTKLGAGTTSYGVKAPSRFIPAR